MTDQAIKRAQNTLAWAFLPLLAVGVIGLFYFTSSVRDQLRGNAIQTCQITNRARRESNLHLRRPLKSIGQQIVFVLDEAAANADKLGRPGQAAQTRKVANAFAKAAAQVKYLPQLDCAKLNGG